MSNEIEYIEPTQEHVGQIVEVKLAGVWVKRKLLAVLLEPQVYRFICEHSDCKDEFAKWREARIPRPLTYAERQARCGLKVGDRVKFVRAWDSDEYKCIECDSLMRRALVGTCGEVIGIGNHIQVQFPQYYGLSWYLPYFVLEKVEDRLAVHDDYGKTVYVADCPQDEFKLVTTFCEVITEPHSCTWFGVVRSGDKRFVYELSNLRVKE